MQAAVQKYVDSSISKTINVAADISFEDFKEVYLQAYDTGCKGCTTYRPNEITGAVLEAPGTAAETETGGDDGRDARQEELPLGAPPPRAEDQFEAGAVVYMTQPLDRPGELPGKTYKLKWPESDHAIYITLNDVIQDGRQRPFEIFINSKNMDHYAASCRHGKASPPRRARLPPKARPRPLAPAMAPAPKVPWRDCASVPNAAPPAWCTWKAAICACPAATPNAREASTSCALGPATHMPDHSTRLRMRNHLRPCLTSRAPLPVPAYSLSCLTSRANRCCARREALSAARFPLQSLTRFTSCSVSQLLFSRP
jgi:hypothetical protein